MKVIAAFRHQLGRVLRVVCVALFVLMVVLVCAQVAARFFQVVAPWTDVASRIAFLWFGFIGAAYVIGENEDVAIDWLVGKLPVAAARVVSMISHLVVCFFALWVMVWGGYRNVAAGWTDGVQLLPVTQGQVFLVIPLSGFLIALYSIFHMVDVARAPAGSFLSRSDEDIDISTLTDEGI